MHFSADQPGDECDDRNGRLLEKRCSSYHVPTRFVRHRVCTLVPAVRVMS